MGVKATAVDEALGEELLGLAIILVVKVVVAEYDDQLLTLS